MKLRFRRYGQTEWTYITVEGELETEAMSVLGAGLSLYHVQVWDRNKWENLWG